MMLMYDHHIACEDHSNDDDLYSAGDDHDCAIHLNDSQ